LRRARNWLVAMTTCSIVPLTCSVNCKEIVMLDSLYIGASGMQAQQQNVDAISNNLANVNTSGYKRSRIDFEDLLYRASPGTRPDTGQPSG
jgi:hypothetical protein